LCFIIMCLCNFACQGHPRNDLYCVGREVRPYSLFPCVCSARRYSALSAVADVTEAARNRSIGRSVGGLSSAVGGREYSGRMSGPSSRGSLTPRSSQEKSSAFDTTPLTASRYYNSSNICQ